MLFTSCPTKNSHWSFLVQFQLSNNSLLDGCLHSFMFICLLFHNGMLAMFVKFVCNNYYTGNMQGVRFQKMDRP